MRYRPSYDGRSHSHSCTHYLSVDGRVLIVFQEDGLDVEANLVDIMTEALRPFPPMILIDLRYNYCHIDVAPFVGTILCVGAEHHHLHRWIEAWSDHLFVTAL